MKHMLGWFAGLLLVTSLSAQISGPPLNFARNTTTLTMGLDIANGVIAPAGPSRVRIPPGERVVMSVPPTGQAAIQWTKDDKVIPGATATTYTVVYATAADSGVYRVTGFAFPTVSTGIDLDVVNQGNFGNVSSRIELTGGNAQVVGFVVSGKKGKSILYRAVGPTLQKFGITSPARRPQLKLFDAAGREMGFVHPAVVIDVNALFRSLGAFPVDDSELSTLSFDYGPIAPGAYTLVVADAAKTGGTTLVEVYEME